MNERMTTKNQNCVVNSDSRARNLSIYVLIWYEFDVLVLNALVHTKAHSLVSFSCLIDLMRLITFMVYYGKGLNNGIISSDTCALDFINYCITAIIMF